MSICPLCNGIEDYPLVCTNCSSKLEDQGKISDYYDDYSPYLLDEITSKVDIVPIWKLNGHVLRTEKAGIMRRGSACIYLNARIAVRNRLK